MPFAQHGIAKRARSTVSKVHLFHFIPVPHPVFQCWMVIETENGTFFPSVILGSELKRIVLPGLFASLVVLLFCGHRRI